MICRRYGLACALLLALFALAGCGGDEAVPEAAPQKKAAPPKVAPAPDALEALPEAEAPVAAYVYDPGGRRDPFEPLLMVKQAVSRSELPMTPLQKVEVNQLRLIGIIVGKGASRAMVIAPDGKSYILTKGVKVGRNDGVVVEIERDAVVVEERFYDFFGEVKTNLQRIQVPQREGV